jgi:spermidine synthase
LAIFGNYNIQEMHSGGFYKTDEWTKNLGKVVYYKEGVYATVTVREIPRASQVIGYILFINGYNQGSNVISDLRVNSLLAYLPNIINSKINNALVIGLGTGTTSGHLSKLTNTTTVEIEPAVVGATNYFRLLNQNLLENSNHTLVIDDARNYLLKNNKKYDLIVSEPTVTWQSFSTQLYSKEFFEIANKNLNEGGLFVKWIPIYTLSTEDFKSMYKTFNSVFPYTVAFANIKYNEDIPLKIETSEIILIGSNQEISLNESRLKERYNSLPSESKKYLETLGLKSENDLYNLLLFTNKDLQNYANQSKIITDDYPILEFSTAKKMLNQNPSEIIQDIEKNKITAV